MTSPWLVQYGLAQGRLRPAGWLPAQGRYAFVLGRDLPGQRRWFQIGDYVEVHQTGTVPNGSTVLRAKLHVRGAATMPLGTVWRLSLRVDGTAYYEHELRPGRERTLLDVGIPHRITAGSHTIAFRLELAGPGTGAPYYDVELPGVYLDALTFDTTAGAVLLNRDPEPDEAGVPVDSTIALDFAALNTPGPTPWDASTLRVWVNGVPALIGTAFQPGFSGVRSSVVAIGGQARVVIDPVDPLPADVTVRALGVTTDAVPVDSTWRFATEDLVPPTVVAATAVGRKILRVEFSEPVNAAAFVASSYSIERAPCATSEEAAGGWGPYRAPDGDAWEASVPLTVVAAAAGTPDDGRHVDLTTQWEMTPGAGYLLVVSEDVADANGNTVVAPGDRAVFAGYAPPRPASRDFSLPDRLPLANFDAVDDDDELRRLLAVWQGVFDLVLSDVDALFDRFDPDTAPAADVETWLADLRNPFPLPATDAGRRQLVQLLIPLRKLKGTNRGIILAVRLLVGVEVTIRAPWQGGWKLGSSKLGVSTRLSSSARRDRATFWIVAPRKLTTDEKASIDRIAKYMKDARKHHLLVEPPDPEVVDDFVRLGYSKLGVNFTLRG